MSKQAQTGAEKIEQYANAYLNRAPIGGSIITQMCTEVYPENRVLPVQESGTVCLRDDGVLWTFKLERVSDAYRRWWITDERT